VYAVYFETYFGLEYPLPKMGECLFMQGRFVYVYKTSDFDACIDLRKVFSVRSNRHLNSIIMVKHRWWCL